ncbi:prenyltransferase/squalene oxidase repeat-containing protein [Kitasatospora sp. NPDC058218]|uniref:prenyltransferase/squalene oxidase repeat-containing protein n=1 Tax=Kitasatospora sp. NPDC058218 TaxID=3346385 RepID=UPI0036DDA13A
MRVSSSRTRHRGRDLASLLVTGAVAVAAGGAVLLGHPGSAAADPIEECTATTGAIVAVDFGHWGGGVVRGCDAHPTTGMNLLHAAGFTTTGTEHDGPAFICRLGNGTFDSGTQYPTAAEETCVNTPQATAYWSYWIAEAGQQSWSYSRFGAGSQKPEPGEVEAWVYGGTDVGGTSGAPTFTPDSVRAKNSGPSPSASPSASRSPSSPFPSRTGPPPATGDPATTTPTPPAGKTPDLARGSAYLTDPAHLIDGDYYEAFPSFADFGLTIDGAYALAATGTDDAALRRIVDFLDQQGKDAGDRTVNDWTGIGTEYAGGGSIGKEALLAEAVGRDPRAFGGHDLIAALALAVCARPAPDTGCEAAGNYTWATSVFSQSLGIMAQLRAGDTANAAAPIGYLKSLQHADGSWPSLIPATGDSDVDSTAMAVMAFALVPGDEAAQAVDKGLAWLAGRQLADGGFPGAAGDSTNSAALAVQGMTLRQSAYSGQIAKARDFLAGRQNGDGGFNVASAGQQGSDVRASTQALGGTTGISFGTLHRDLGGTPTPTPTATATATATGTPTPTATATATPTATATATATATPTPTTTATGTPTGTGSPTPTASPTGTGTPVPAGTSTVVPAPTGDAAGGNPAARVPAAHAPGGNGAPVRDAGAGVAAPVVRADGDSLARTGTDALGLALAAGMLTAAGAAAVLATRRRSAAGPGRHR